MSKNSMLLATAAMLLLGACSSAPNSAKTEEVSSEFAGKRYTNLLVLGV